MSSQTLLLPDGRYLGYAVYGEAAGKPVLYFHGTPSSRLELNLLKQYEIDFEYSLLQAGLQMIAVDRPGMGLSSFHPNRTFLSFADDVYTLLNSLGISSSSIMCWSGGGPYALAMAWKYPALITNVFIVCGFSRRFTAEIIRKMGRNKWYFLSAKWLPGLLEFSLNKARRAKVSRSLPQWLSGLPDADFQLVKNPKHLQAVAEFTLNEACRQGSTGPVVDAQMYFNDFGFDISDIHQPVHFWWGTEDNAVIRSHAEAVEHQLKNSTLHYREGEGHLSAYVHCYQDVIEHIRHSNVVG